jgi:hypothetical protein
MTKNKRQGRTVRRCQYLGFTTGRDLSQYGSLFWNTSEYSAPEIIFLLFQPHPSTAD